MTFFQKLTYRFPGFVKLLKKLSSRERNTVWQDMSLCTAVSLTCAFYEFEKFLPESFTRIVRGLLIFLFCVCWVWCSFVNGFWKRYAFAAYTVAFWLIPQILIHMQAGMQIENYNKYLDAAGQYAILINEFPLKGLNALLAAETVHTIIMVIAWCLASFLAGTALKVFCKKNLL